MANPRKTYEFQELRVTRLTAAAHGSIVYARDEPYGTASRHAPVKFTSNNTVGLCSDGDIPFGSLERVEADGSVVVAYEGSVMYAGTGTAGGAVVANGTGGVRAADSQEDEVGIGTVGSSANGVVIVFQ